jgi:hypothetical protein
VFFPIFAHNAAVTYIADWPCMACALPSPAGTDLWCGQHNPATGSSRAAQHKACCQVAFKISSSSSSSGSDGGAWQACSEAPLQGSCFCSQHQHMQKRNRAAAAEQQGLRAVQGQEAARCTGEVVMSAGLTRQAGLSSRHRVLQACISLTCGSSIAPVLVPD